MTVRLLQALAGGPHGGAEMHFVRLAIALHEAGVEQKILARPAGGRIQALRDAGLDVTGLRFGGPLDLRTRFGFRRAVRVFRPDIVLTYMSRATRFCPASQDFIHVARLGGYYPIKYYRHCDYLVGITPDIVDYLVGEGWPRERTDVIPNFVHDEAPAAPARRAEWDTPEDAPLLFALGRLHRNKAFDILLEALAELEGAYLWLAGEGPERAALEAQARDLAVLDRVRFLGWQDRPGPFFAASDVYVVPSRHEPLGSVLLEGWMHEVPMVAAASQGPRFLLTHEKDSLIVPVDDAPALAGAIRRLLKDRTLAERLAKAGRKAYEEDYTEAAAVERYLALFEKLMSRKKS